MEHRLILERLQQIDGAALPGVEAHQVFFENKLDDRSSALEQNRNPRLSSVAAILTPVDGQSNIVLIKRPEYDGAHSGQMAFPGGKVEPEDENLIATALRETYEEVGVESSQLALVTPFTRVYIPPSRFLVYPHLFVSESELEFVADPREVDSVVLLPVERLLDDQAFVRGSVELVKPKMKIQTWYFDHQPHVIWGATALMLHELKLMLKNVLKDE